KKVIDQLRATPSSKDDWSHNVLLSLYATDYHLVGDGNLVIQWTDETRIDQQGSSLFTFSPRHAHAVSPTEKFQIQTYLEDQYGEVKYYTTKKELEGDGDLSWVLGQNKLASSIFGGTVSGSGGAYASRGPMPAPIGQLIMDER